MRKILFVLLFAISVLNLFCFSFSPGSFFDQIASSDILRSQILFSAVDNSNNIVHRSADLEALITDLQNEFLSSQNKKLFDILKFSILLMLILISFSFYLSRIRKKEEINHEILKRKALEREFNELLKQNQEEFDKQKLVYSKSKNELKRSQDQYKTLVNNLHEGMVIVDKDENFLFVNKIALEIYGRTEDEVIGHNVSEFTDAKEFNLILQQTSLRKTGQSSKYETIILQPNGESKIVKVSASPVFDKKKYSGAIAVFIDITEQKKIESLQSVIFNISNMVNTAKGLDDLYKVIHMHLGILMNTTNFYIALYNEKTNIITAPYYVDELSTSTPEPQTMGNGITAYLIRLGKPLFLTVEKRNELIKERSISDSDWKSKIWLGVPLKIQDNVIGAVVVQSYTNPDAYNRKDLWILEFVSDQIALAISKKRAERALKESEKFNRAIIENSPLAISARDSKGKLIIANKAWEELWGKSEKDMMKDFRERKEFKLDKHDDYLQSYHTQIEEIYSTGSELYIPELKVFSRGKNTNEKWISHYFYALKNEMNEVDKVIIITEDITERKLAEEHLKASLAEKEILLKEVHHRVKNNMQVISSMLKLQSRYIDDSKSLSIFKDSQNRVKSMALIHEKLYQSKNFENIDFEQYLRLLLNYLFRSFSVSDKTIKTYINADDVQLDITKAIPAGLIINEFVSNSIKHAFKGREKGNIHLKMTRKKNNFVLNYKDDGIGFPEDIDFEKTNSLGMQLVNALTQQLHGKISLVVDNGTEFKLIFPVKQE